MALSSLVKGRSSQQAGANTETETGEVVKTYPDGNGNVLRADIRLPGQPRLLPRVPNSSGLRLVKGMQITLNWAQGSRHQPSIIAASGSASGAALQTATGSTTTSAGQNNTTGNVDFSGTAFLMAFPDESLPGAYTEQPGANVLMIDVEPVGDGSGSGPIGGTRTIHAIPLVLTELPSTSGLLDGTCVDLVDEDNEPNGMYRLSAGVWVRRDTPGEGGVSTDDRANWDGAATDATTALSDAADAQDAADAAQSTASTVTTEITNARTRDSASGFAANTYASLKAHLAALWAAFGLRTADPTGVPDGYVSTVNGGVVAWAEPTGGSGGSGGPPEEEPLFETVQVYADLLPLVDDVPTYVVPTATNRQHTLLTVIGYVPCTLDFSQTTEEGTAHEGKRWTVVNNVQSTQTVTLINLAFGGGIGGTYSMPNRGQAVQIMLTNAYQVSPANVYPTPFGGFNPA